MMNLKKDIEAIIGSTDSLFIYGTGVYGRNIYNVLNEFHIRIDAFVETKPEKTELFGLPIYTVDDILQKKCCLVLGLNRLNSGIVQNILQNKHFNMDNVIYGYKYIDNGGERGGYNVDVPTMEITTRIGCSVNCRYCPQSSLIANYRVDEQADRQISIDTFKKCLNKLPLNCSVLFCGMAEPLLNADCIEMIKIAIDSGRKVDLYTTLIGIDESQLDELLNLPISFVTLHVADKYNYAKIKTDDMYYRMIEKTINYVKNDGKPFVNICNAQAEPDEKVKDICKGKYEIIHELHDRAGNLDDDILISSARKRKGKISCSLCGQSLNHNILLPDGKVLLCCMDYGMKHVLGNLLHQSYDEIMNGDEMQRLRRAINGDEEIDILCRGCSSATEIINI